MPNITIIAPISQVPYGVVSTISALRNISVSTLTDGNCVNVLGSGAANDGYQSFFFFSGACTYSDNGSTIIKPSVSTGAWVRAIPSPHVSVSSTVSISGNGENFILISGGGTPDIYTFAPSYIMYGHDMIIKSIGTGQVRIQATGGDTIFPINSLNVVPSITFQSSGAAYHFRVGQGVYYQV